MAKRTRANERATATAAAPASLLGQPVVVVWEDAWVEELGEYTIESIAKIQPVILRSIGVVIRDDDSGVTIARELPESVDGEYRGIQHISRPMVRRVVRLEFVDEL